MAAIIEEYSTARQQKQQKDLSDSHPDLQVSIPAVNGFPIDHFPILITEAAKEIEAYLNVPIELVASSLLVVFATGVQGQFKVRIDGQQVHLLCLYFMFVLEANERKSSNDKITSRPLHEWQKEQMKIFQPKLRAYEAEMIAWEAKRANLEKTLKDKPDDESAKTELVTHLGKEPKKPRDPHMIFDEFTREGLVSSLTEGWPSGIILTAEGASFTAGTGFTASSPTALLGVLNRLHSGESVGKTLKTEKGTLEGGVVSLSVAIQGNVLKEWFKLTKGQGRASGFFGRTNVIKPARKAGNRPRTKASEGDFPKTDLFCQRVKAILDQQHKYLSPGGMPRQKMIDITPEADEILGKYYDAVEGEQAENKPSEFYSDVVGKSVEQAARISALFALADNCDEEGINPNNIPLVDEKNMVRAVHVAKWYMESTRAFFAGEDMPDLFGQVDEVTRRCVGRCLEKLAAMNAGGTADNTKILSDRLGYDQLSQRDIYRELCPAAIKNDRRRFNEVIGELLATERFITPETLPRGRVIYTVNPLLLKTGRGVNV